MNVYTKWVDEYVKESCDICNSLEDGLFVIINTHQICNDCSKHIAKSLKLDELDRKLNEEFGL